MCRRVAGRPILVAAAEREGGKDSRPDRARVVVEQAKLPPTPSLLKPTGQTPSVSPVDRQETGLCPR